MGDEPAIAARSTSSRSPVQTSLTRGFVFAAVISVIVVVTHLTLDVPVARIAWAYNPAQFMILRLITETGEGQWWLGSAAIVFVIAALTRRHNLARWAALMLIAVGTSGVLANVIKVLVGKTRPALFFETERFGFEPWSFTHHYNSFPSGHATTFGAGAMVLALAFPRARLLFFAVGLVGALTRCALLAHYLSDVVAGLALGGSFGCASIHVWRRYFAASAPIAFARVARIETASRDHTVTTQ